MFKRILFHSIILAACCLILPDSASAGPVSITFGENTGAFSLTIVGSAIEGSRFYGFPLGALWEIEFTVFEDDNASSDELRFSGTVLHRSAPHGEPAGKKIPFSVAVVSSSGGTFTVQTDVSEPHAPTNHLDTVISAITFSVLNPQPGVSRITGYTVRLRGFHCNTCPLPPAEKPIPEPTTLILLVTGFAGVAIKRWKAKTH